MLNTDCKEIGKDRNIMPNKNAATLNGFKQFKSS